jgi:hypothetical protein
MIQGADWKIGTLLASTVFFALSCTRVLADEPPSTEGPKDWIHLIAPVENTEVTGKKPLLKADFLEPIQLPTLVVALDGTDITQLLAITEKGFEYRPVVVLPGGEHSLSISATDIEGNPLQKNFSFSSRHSRSFEEAFTANEASLIYEQLLADHETPADTPRSKIEGNLKSDSKIKREAWTLSFNTNLRYLDQSTAAISPMEKGLEIANWLLMGSYVQGALSSKLSWGDILVDETPYTISNLTRRGGSFQFEYDRFQLNLFSMKSEQVFGFEGGVGPGETTDDHIQGISGGIKFFDKKLEWKTVYITGGEPGSSFGISTVPGVQKGDVLGFLLTSDFFQNKMKTELEADFSRFDPDTVDEFGSKSDSAYRAKLSGQLNQYSYEAMVEYIGQDYQVVSNQTLPKDKQGVSLTNGLTLETQNIQLLLSGYQDNVRGDDLFPRITDYSGTLDYSFNKFPNIPLGLTYQKSIQDSSREPPGTAPIQLHTDTVTGRVGYNLERWMFNLQTSYSLMDDRTDDNNDSTAMIFTFSPSYNSPELSVIPSLSYNQSKSHLTDVRTDTYIATLDFRSKWLQERISFDLGSTYNVIRANDDSLDSQTLNSNIRLAYNIKNFLKDYLTPSVALRATYNKITDKVNPSLDREEFSLFLVLATAVLFSY